MKRLAHLLNARLARAGLRLVRTGPIDLRSAEIEPGVVLARRAARFDRGVVLDIPLERCRNSLGTAFGEQEPYVATLRRDATRRYEGSLLEQFYAGCQPRTAAEALGLSADEAPGLAALPAPAFTMPWRNESPEAMLRRRSEWLRQEAAALGLTLSLEDGYNHFGPVTATKGRLEMERLRRVEISVRRSGFQRHDGREGDVTGVLLMQRDGFWCVEIRAGQHRTAVAAALGLTSIPVRFLGPPVKREDVDYWPQVVAGRITRDGAWRVFDRVMRGDPPPSCRLEPAESLEAKQPVVPNMA